jgi:hypothetical protein
VTKWHHAEGCSVVPCIFTDGQGNYKCEDDLEALGMRRKGEIMADYSGKRTATLERITRLEADAKTIKPDKADRVKAKLAQARARLAAIDAKASAPAKAPKVAKTAKRASRAKR